MFSANAAGQVMAIARRWLVISSVQGALIFTGGCQSRPEGRLWVEAKVNGKDMVMAVDTCSSSSFLFRSAAESLGLKIADPGPDWRLPPGAVALGSTEPCDLSFWGSTVRLSLAVAKTPRYVDFRMDGMIGWPEMRDKVFRIDAAAGKLEPLDALPDDIATWTKFPVLTNASIMILIVPRPAGGPGLVYVDTGSMHGVGLAPDKWKEWRAAHPDEPRTISAYYTPGAGVVSGEVAWAREWTLGPLKMTETPVEESDPITPNIVQGHHEATFGLAALKRVDFILDGRNGVAYLRPRNTPPEPYDHNRLGAVFVPLDKTSEMLTARVIPGTPAYDAGLRDGDVLLSINGYPAGNWASARGVGVPSFEWPARTNVNLYYIRGGATHRAHAWLRDIIGPGTPAYEAGYPATPGK